jgi:hypothetical protein
MRRAAACALILFAAGCSGTSTTASPPTTTVTAAVDVPTSASASAASAPAAPAAPAAAAGNPVNGADFCGLLQKHLVEITSAASPAHALEAFSGVMAELVRTHPSERPRALPDIDAAAIATCPAARDTALKALATDSFHKALGGS